MVDGRIHVQAQAKAEKTLQKVTAKEAKYKQGLIKVQAKYDSLVVTLNKAKLDVAVRFFFRFFSLKNIADRTLYFSAKNGGAQEACCDQDGKAPDVGEHEARQGGPRRAFCALIYTVNHEWGDLTSPSPMCRHNELPSSTITRPQLDQIGYPSVTFIPTSYLSRTCTIVIYCHFLWFSTSSMHRSC